MNTEIVLEVRQNLGVDGWQDEDGTEHYDRRVITPFGELGELRTDPQAEDVVITEADGVILVRHGFPTQWSRNVRGVSIDTTFSGVQIMTVKAANGEVRYQLDPRPVRWSDGDSHIPFYLGLRIHSDIKVGA